MADERRTIAVEHRKELSYLLCQAAEIEHMAMCQYLYAAFSLRTETGPGLTSEQLEAVERWRRSILKIAGEEMLHWALVNNLLTAIGSAPFVSRPNLPHRAKGYPPSVQFALLGFGEDALRHFVYFERPQDVEVEEVDAFAPVGPAPAPMTADEMQPRPQDFVSQGELYRALDDGLGHLAGKLGEEGLFIGPPSAQAGPESFGWPDLIPVTDLASARTALTRIIEQGEGGTSLDVETAHYGRFLSILEEYLELRAADPSFEPAHPVTAAIVRTVEGEEPSGPFVTEATTAAASDLFNVVNDLLLHVLSRYFAFGDEDEPQLAALADVALTLMFGAIAPLGTLLARLPVGPQHPGATAGANFQLAYRSNFLLPHRRVAWIRYFERLLDAADFADEITDATAAPTMAAVAGALRRASSTLSAHILDLPIDRPSAAAPATPATAEPAAPKAPAPPAEPGPGIRVRPAGPYLVDASLPLRRARYVHTDAGEPLTTQTTERLQPRGTGRVALCRCGGSADKPYCDGSHQERDWDSTEAAPTAPYDERAAAIEGGAGVITVRDDRSTCSHAGFCATKATTVWTMVRELSPDDTAARSAVVAIVERCPSGALTYRLEADGEDVEQELACAIAVVEDGPLQVTGGVTVERSDGTTMERRNRLVLCRCGASNIKPLCDGSHVAAGFRDPAR